MTQARRLWGAPILLGAASAFGLAAGLLGDGVWDWISAAALALPLLAAGWYIARPARSPH